MSENLDVMPKTEAKEGFKSGGFLCESIQLQCLEGVIPQRYSRHSYSGVSLWERVSNANGREVFLGGGEKCFQIDCDDGYNFIQLYT